MDKGKKGNKRTNGTEKSTGNVWESTKEALTRALKTIVAVKESDGVIKFIPRPKMLITHLLTAKASTEILEDLSNVNEKDIEVSAEKVAKKGQKIYERIAKEIKEKKEGGSSDLYV